MALAPLKLPKLQARIPIVDGKGMPTAAFIRYWNIDFIGALENNVNSLNDVYNQLAAQLAQILAAQAAADAAQATADDALALAMDANGARYVSLVGPYDIEETVDNVTDDIKTDLSESIQNVTIDANTSIDVLLSLEETDGGSPNIIGTQAFTLNSDGTQNPDLSWNTGSVGSTISGFGTLIGTVTYRLLLTRVSGANFVSKGNGAGTLTLTPRAQT